MKIVKNILNAILNLAIISAMCIGVYAYISTPTMSDIEVRETANAIHEMEISSIKDSDPTTWEVVWVSDNYDKAWMSINGDIHVFEVFEAYDDCIIIEDFNGQLQCYEYWS